MRRQDRTKAGLATAAAFVAAVALLAAARAGADPGRGSRSLEGWSRLTLEARKAVIFSATTTLDLSEAPYAASGKPAIVLKTRSEAHIMGATGFSEETTSWIDRASHRPLEFFQLRPGGEARRYVFLDAAVRQTTYEPPGGKPDSAFAEWHEVETVDRKLTYADGTQPRPGDPVSDFYSLIYLLRDLDLSSDSASKEMDTLYRRHVVRVRLAIGDRRRNEREVVNEATGATETLRLRERRIEVKPLGEGARSFRGLMGMQGDTAIWIDEASGALLEVDGVAPGLGATTVQLASFRR